MLIRYFILCCSVLIVDCVKVTVNYEKKSYWYQTRAKNEVFDFKDVSRDISYQTMMFEREREYDKLLAIQNFPELEKIDMKNFETTIIPNLSNLPMLKTFSIFKNKVNYVNKTSFSKVPLKMIVLTSNNISMIEDGSFGMNLAELYLTCNQLTTLSPKWFTNPQALEELIGNGNKIQDIPEYMFQNFSNLRAIKLRNNEIKTIGYRAFEGVSNLYVLQLSYNQIEEIKPSVLGADQKVQIQTLDIQYNHLSFLHKDFLKQLNVTSLEIWGNPWQCPCRDEIYDWHRKNVKNDYAQLGGFAREGDPSCVFALSSSYACVYAVDEELVQTYLENFQRDPLDICTLFV